MSGGADMETGKPLLLAALNRLQLASLRLRDKLATCALAATNTITVSRLDLRCLDCAGDTSCACEGTGSLVAACGECGAELGSDCDVRFGDTVRGFIVTTARDGAEPTRLTVCDKQKCLLLALVGEVEAIGANAVRFSGVEEIMADAAVAVVRASEADSTAFLAMEKAAVA